MYKKTLKKHGIIDCNLKNDYQIVIIFSANISDAAAHQMTVQFPTEPTSASALPGKTEQVTIDNVGDPCFRQWQCSTYL